MVLCKCLLLLTESQRKALTGSALIFILQKLTKWKNLTGHSLLGHPQARYSLVNAYQSCKNAVAVELREPLKPAPRLVVIHLSYAQAASRTFWNAHASLCRLVAQNRAYLTKAAKLRPFFSLARNDFKLTPCHCGKLVQVVHYISLNRFEVTPMAGWAPL
jgi:hypothetical protein